MSKPATQRKRVPPSSPEPFAIWGCEHDAAVRVSSYRLLQMPLGAIHLNDAWRILEYRRAGDEPLLPAAPAGKHLFALAPWINDPTFVEKLELAIHSGVSNFHFDFKVSANTAERMIHVNILTLGDMTAWLFISDNSLPPL